MCACTCVCTGMHMVTLTKRVCGGGAAVSFFFCSARDRHFSPMAFGVMQPSIPVFAMVRGRGRRKVVSWRIEGSTKCRLIARSTWRLWYMVAYGSTMSVGAQKRGLPPRNTEEISQTRRHTRTRFSLSAYVATMRPPVSLQSETPAGDICHDATSGVVLVSLSFYFFYCCYRTNPPTPKA